MATRRTLRSLASGMLALLLLGVPAFAEGGQDALQLGAKLFEAGKLDEALVDFAQAAEAPDASTAKVAAAYAGLCYLRKADYDQSIDWFERALEKDPKYLAALENLTGACFARRSTYEKGMQIAQRAEALYSREPAVYYNMACYYALAKRADLALRNLDKALYFGFSDLEHLAADEDFAGVRELEPCKRFFARLDSVGAAEDLRDRGAKMSAALGYGEAKQLYEESLKHYEDALGEGSVAGTACLLALGSVSLATGQFDAAIGYDEKALTTQIEILGSEHPDVATCLGNLGLARYYKGEYDLAIEYYGKALAIQLKSLGEGHANVAASYNNLGGAYYSKGELDRSIEFYDMALAIWTQTLGPEHPRVAASYDNLGNAYQSKGAYDEAISYYSKALAIQSKSLGAEHPDVAQSYDNLGAPIYERESTTRPSRSTGGRWRYDRRSLARSTRIRRRAIATWGSSIRIRVSTPAPSTTARRPWL